MTKLYNKKPIKTVRRLLRKNMSSAEQRIWFKLRYKKLGYRFLRQYSIDRFVIDFYCPQRRLAIEIDGSHHNDEVRRAYDAERTKYLNSKGIRVVRFWNDRVLKQTDQVVEEIWSELQKTQLKTHL